MILDFLAQGYSCFSTDNKSKINFSNIEGEFGIQLESVTEETKVWCKNDDAKEEFKIKLISSMDSLEEQTGTTSLPLVEIENGPDQEKG